MAIPNIWRTKNERYQLQGAICNTCSEPLFPARHTCPNCSRATSSTQASPLSIATPAKRHYAMPTHQPAQALANVGDD